MKISINDVAVAHYSQEFVEDFNAQFDCDVEKLMLGELGRLFLNSLKGDGVIPSFENGASFQIHVRPVTDELNYPGKRIYNAYFVYPDGSRRMIKSASAGWY